MPLKAINYDKTHFYKIVCKDLDIKDCYVGHTTDFTTRKRQHKNSCNNEASKQYHYNVYDFIRNNGGWTNWEMILIETLKCENNLEARKKEREFLEQIGATLNKESPYRSDEEAKQQKKDWIQNNWEKNYESVKKSRVRLKEEHPERYKEYSKKSATKYREKNPDRLKINTTCECGSEFRKHQLNRHLKSKKHQQYLQSQTNPQE